MWERNGTDSLATSFCQTRKLCHFVAGEQERNNGSQGEGGKGNREIVKTDLIKFFSLGGV